MCRVGEKGQRIFRQDGRCSFDTVESVPTAVESPGEKRTWSAAVHCMLASRKFGSVCRYATSDVQVVLSSEVRASLFNSIFPMRYYDSFFSVGGEALLEYPEECTHNKA